MPSQKFLFAQITVLWLAVALLAALTGLIHGSSSKPVGLCASLSSPINSTISIDSETCNLTDYVAMVVHQHASYFQALHIIIIQAIAACCLASFKPALLAMEWTRVETRTTLAALQTGMELTQSPGLSTAILHTITSKSISMKNFFVLLVAGLSILSPIAVSPIYRSHTGPYSASADLEVGGGVGPSISSSYDVEGIVPGGVATGRALLNAANSARLQPPLLTFNVSAAPFITRDTIQAIWSATVSTVVAYNTIDCGPTAPNRLVPSGRDIVSFDTSIFFNNAVQGVIPLIAGSTFGYITNDPQVTAVYLNSTASAEPGVVSATTSVVFLAVNGTLEGAQQTITSTLATSRADFVDVLVCTSTTKLVISNCSINQGNVTQCSAVPSSDLPSLPSTFGSVETYITNPPSVAMTLSASPVTAYYSLYGRLPMYNSITPDLIASDTPPLSFLTLQTTGNHYHLPLTYVRNALFGQTAQGLVQGMLTAWTVTKKTHFQLSATFSVSHVPFLYLVLCVATVCAIASTLWSTLPASSRHATKIDAARLVAISRNPNLDATFVRYADRRVEIDDFVQNSEVAFVWDERLGRSALVLGNEADHDWDDGEKEMVPGVSYTQTGMRGKDLEPLVWH
ncbi:hypothetical protein CPB83DRAFT_884483 [Crepidotus variabilis]|uniref:Uncharacterized protein n=1 Tax=Crepidotus variabilis TaxID=179855 RepID=A0A9P6JP00_9AGAR|nr:hypothetical protein CPB83DRAFT_884483 [Crepidotus variabilis]